MEDALKGLIQPNPIAVSRFQFTVSGFIPIVFTEVDGLEQEIDGLEAPDRTSHPSGVSKYTEFTVKVPAHHTQEIAVMTAWYNLSLGNVDPEAKRTAILEQFATDGSVAQSWFMQGCYCKKFEPQSNDMSNDNDIGIETYSLCADILTRL